MSVFVGAYVSMWDVWPDQPVVLTLTTEFVLGQRGPSGLGRAELTLLTTAGREPGTLCRDRVASPPCPALPACREELPGGAGGSVTGFQGSCTLA